MRTTPSDDSSTPTTSARPLRRARIASTLTTLAFVGVIVAFTLVASSFALGLAVNAAIPMCDTASGCLTDMQTTLNTVWLAGGVMVVFASVCGALATWIARQGEPEATGAARVALMLSAIALAGFALSFCRFEIVSFGQCIG